MPEKTNQLTHPELQPHDDGSHDNGVGVSPQPLSAPQQQQQPPYGQQPYYGQPQYGIPPVSNYVLPQQQPQGPPQQFQQAPTKPPKKGFFRIVVPVPLWALILVLAVVLIATVAYAGKGNTPTTGSSSSTRSSGNSTVPTSTPELTSTPTPVPTQIPTGLAKVGSTITVNDVACTLVSVKPIQSDEFNLPKAGNEYIVVHVKLVNNSDHEVDYNPLNFHVKTGSGNISDVDFATPQSYIANNILSYGKLASGGTVEGDLIFQAPKGDHKAEFTWQSSYLGNASDNVWNLGL